MRRFLLLVLTLTMLGMAGCFGGCGSDPNKAAFTAKDRPRPGPD